MLSPGCSGRRLSLATVSSSRDIAAPASFSGAPSGARGDDRCVRLSIVSPVRAQLFASKLGVMAQVPFFCTPWHDGDAVRDSSNCALAGLARERSDRAKVIASEGLTHLRSL
jgi:hypothetical protein